MSHQTGRNANTSTEAVTASVTLNTTTAVTIATVNEDRIHFEVNNNGSALGFWVRLYPAAQDDLKHGIWITPKTGSRPFWEMPNDNIYTGEISAIAEMDSPTAYTTEY